MMGSPCLSTCVQMTTGRLLCEDTLAALRPLVTRMASLLLTPATTCTNQRSPSGHVTVCPPITAHLHRQPVLGELHRVVQAQPVGPHSQLEIESYGDSRQQLIQHFNNFMCKSIYNRFGWSSPR